MSKLVIMALLAAFLLPAYAQKKSCDELKAEIEAKLKAKGVAKYTLEIVAAGEAKDGKEVGSCDGGAKKILYRRAS